MQKDTYIQTYLSAQQHFVECVGIMAIPSKRSASTDIVVIEHCQFNILDFLYYYYI